MSEKVIIANVSECRLMMRCYNCNSSIVFDFHQKKDNGKPRANEVLRQNCPACGAVTGYNRDVKGSDPIETYLEFLRAATASPHFKFQFLVPLDDD